MANLVVLRHLRQHGWAEGFRLWCGLTFLTHELYQYKPRGQAALFFLVLGHIGDVLVLCSFEGKKACKSMVYQPMTAHDPDKLDPVVQPELRAVTSVTDWSAIPTQVKAPLTAQLLHKYKGDLPPGIVLFQHSGTCSVWKHAAQMGFRSVPEHVCREIANECQLEAPVGYIPLVPCVPDTQLICTNTGFGTERGQQLSGSSSASSTAASAPAFAAGAGVFHSRSDSSGSDSPPANRPVAGQSCREIVA